MMEHVLLLHKKGKNKPFNPLTLTFEGESLFPTVKKKNTGIFGPQVELVWEEGLLCP